MLKEYRKTATIKTEQFDGSKEMIDKYNEYSWLKGKIDLNKLKVEVKN